jgi:hypothetical protein
MLRRLWVLLPIGVLIALCFVGFTRLMGAGIDPPWYRLIPACVLIVAGGAFLPATGLLIARDLLRARNAALFDARTGVVEQFRADESSAAADAAAHPGGHRSELVFSADVLPFSKQVLLVNGAPTPRRRVAQVYESAPPPGEVARYALPSDLLDDILASPPSEGQLDRRRLTEAERGELFERARRARRPTWGLAVLVLWALAVTVSSLASIITGAAGGDHGRAWILPILLSVFAVFRVREFMRDWMMSRLLDADRDDGWVLVWHGQVSEPSPVEVLPRSRLVWSVADSPSKWRLTAARLRA